MKLICLLSWIYVAFSSSVSGQNRSYTRVYLGDAPFDLRTTLDPTVSLDVGTRARLGYALLETDLDSLGLILPKNRTVFLRLEAGKTYYYSYGSGGFRDVSANAFWLTQATYSTRRYRHYILTQQRGIVNASDSDN